MELNQTPGKFKQGDFVMMLFRTPQGTWKAEHLKDPRYAEHDGKRGRVVGCMVLDGMYLYTLRVSANVELRGIPEDCLRYL